jgi:hypothetical protein
MMEVDSDGQEAVAKVSARSMETLELLLKHGMRKYLQLYGVCGRHDGDEAEYELWLNSEDEVSYSRRQSRKRVGMIEVKAEGERGATNTR